MPGTWGPPKVVLFFACYHMGIHVICALKNCRHKYQQIFSIEGIAAVVVDPDYNKVVVLSHNAGRPPNHLQQLIRNQSKSLLLGPIRVPDIFLDRRFVMEIVQNSLHLLSCVDILLDIAVRA